MPANIDLEILQGATFQMKLYWYSDLRMAAITAVSTGVPVTITASAHGLPVDPIPVTITGAKGMRFPEGSVRATAISASQFILDELDGSALGTYRGGGVVTYHAPVSLLNYEARMHVRKALPDTTTLLDLTSANGGLVLGGDEGSIQIFIPATTTEALNFTSGVYDLELVSPIGVVTRLAEGKVGLRKEVTR